MDNGQWQLSSDWSLSPKSFEGLYLWKTAMWAMQALPTEPYIALHCIALHCRAIYRAMWAPPFRLTDWFHPILLFPRISQASAGESGECLDGSAPMVLRNIRTHVSQFSNPLGRNCFTSRVPGFQVLFLESHCWSKHWNRIDFNHIHVQCSMSATIGGSLERLEATVS